jgi:hypothetical protein
MPTQPYDYRALPGGHGVIAVEVRRVQGSRRAARGCRPWGWTDGGPYRGTLTDPTAAPATMRHMAIPAAGVMLLPPNRMRAPVESSGVT